MDFKLPILERQQAHRGFHSKDTGSRGRELAIVSLVAIGLLVVVFVRLFQLTVVQGSYYARLSENNRVREITIEAERGTITDRQGTRLAYNEPVIVASNSARLTSHRKYINGTVLGHLIGYRQKADKNDLEDDPCIGKLALADETGKKGAEKVFECELRGRNGQKLVEYDAHGRAVQTLAVSPAKRGQNIKLAVDLGLQNAAYEAIATSSAKAQLPTIRKAAVVATNPKTGEILTLLSTPSFDPQDFEDETPEIGRVFKNPDQPLFNRATEGSYPPGSIFKIIVASGALQDQTIDTSTIVEDHGFIKAGPSTFHNWYYTEYGKTEGSVDILKAIQRSNDIYFYKVGEKMGELSIKRWSERLGLGNKTTLPFEQSAGTLPSPFWKEEALKERWYLGDTYNYSIGQGYLLTTPLQIHQAETAISSGGTICDPQLLAQATPNCRSVKLDQKTIDIVREGMKRACEPGGTGWPLFGFTVKGRQVSVGCKTGTAEAHGLGDPNPHAWFTVFAPFDDPTIHITVLVENGGQGSDVAAPIAKAMLEYYFTQHDRYKLLPEAKPLEQISPSTILRE